MNPYPNASVDDAIFMSTATACNMPIAWGSPRTAIPEREVIYMERQPTKEIIKERVVERVIEKHFTKEEQQMNPMAWSLGTWCIFILVIVFVVKVIVPKVNWCNFLRPIKRHKKEIKKTWDNIE